MRIEKDKVEQLHRETYKDRPKTEVDLNLIGNEILSEDRQRKKVEDQKKHDEERIKKRTQSIILVISEPTALKQELANLTRKLIWDTTNVEEIIKDVIDFNLLVQTIRLQEIRILQKWI